MSCDELEDDDSSEDAEESLDEDSEELLNEDPEELVDDEEQLPGAPRSHGILSCRSDGGMEANRRCSL